MDKKELLRITQEYQSRLKIYDKDGQLTHFVPAEETEAYISDRMKPKEVPIVTTKSGLSIGIEVANYVPDKEAREVFLSLSENSNALKGMLPDDKKEGGLDF